MKYYTFAYCFVAGFMLAIQKFPAGENTHEVGMKISFTLEASQLTLHEPIMLDVRIENRYQEEVDFDLGYQRKGAFQFTIRTPSGSVLGLPRMKEPPMGGFSRVSTLSLRPNEAYQQRVLVNEWYSFPKTGAYEIRVEFPENSAVGRRSGTAYRQKISRGFQLTIEPRNPEKLKKVCMKLEQQANDHNVEIAMQASLALSYVIDEVSIPFLKAILYNGRGYGADAVAGLARIGSREALDELLAVLSDAEWLERNRELIGTVRHELEQLENRIQDPDLKRKIKLVLRR